MKIEVGKTYVKHGGTNRFKIEVRWSAHLFEGRMINPNTGSPIAGTAYMFNAAGEALGWRGNSVGASLGWSLKDPTPAYEYRLLYEGLVDTKWTPLRKSTPQYVCTSSKFLVREVGNHESTRLIGVEEFKELQKKSPA
jgi:hypothetical protein